MVELLEIYLKSDQWLDLRAKLSSNKQIGFSNTNVQKTLLLEIFFLIYYFFIFNWRISTLQYCDGFCHTATWISHRHIYVFPLLNPDSHLPPQLIPSGCHRTPALRAMHHTSNSHWLSILHMVMYMFQCYTLKSSHPLLLPLSPKQSLQFPSPLTECFMENSVPQYASNFKIRLNIFYPRIITSSRWCQI